MAAHTDVLSGSQYPYVDRHGQSHPYARNAPINGNPSNDWNSGNLDSYNSSYSPYSIKPSFQTQRHHDQPLDSTNFGGWSHPMGDQTQTHSMLAESYARGYPQHYTHDRYPARYPRGDSYECAPDQHLLFANDVNSPQQLLPKSSSSSWVQNNSSCSISPQQRSHLSRSHSTHWFAADQSPGSAQWNDILPPTIDLYETKPGIQSNALEGCSPLSSISSPSPSPSPVQLPSTSAFSKQMISRQSSSDGKPSTKICSHCRATSTPLWRRDPNTQQPLCNACGLYLQQRNKLRPQELIDADIDDNSSDASAGDGTGPECSHCHTHNTSVWRRSKTGEQLCNACGVYSRLRGKDRPLSLKRNKIKPRTKHAPVPKQS
ncbi:hypothetical protein E1B28_008127 [Marasmius oreades]|uniref:GATA-type domain-containing protein n=1 Tax=Marasmius oreades TaxID=181124 RepID=A0A9P7UT03_9AGAR|nr:uncharacterized protein E1B28_008127 [Marasmius oreades]KAG7091726.1 hypothetical protein E1B28_008127 [Marasmius oreades]